MTSKEQYKFEIITKIINKEIKPGLAAKLLGISTHQIRRLKYAILDDGEKAVVHKLKGRKSNHCLNETLKKKALEIVREKYSDFKPAFAAEKLAENEHLSVHPQTLRRWMAEKDLWRIRKQKQDTYRSWRPRKEYYGELQQFDGSYHLWFENRLVDRNGNPIEVCLLASIDDATGKITKASFSANEGVTAVFNFWKEYVLELGKPVSIYLDKFSTYKINHKSAVDNYDLLTQFQRASRDLDIHLIPANSPQAKGRIERLFKTLQDRLIKEMRLAGINTPEEANIFLKVVFLPKFNRRFAVIAVKDGNVHKILSETDKKNLNRVFSIQSKRQVNNDFTIQFKNNWYQLMELQPITVRAKNRVLVEEWLDKTVRFSLRDKYLNYVLLPERPKKTNKHPLILTTHKLNWKPSANHPWRKAFKQQC